MHNEGLALSDFINVEGRVEQATVSLYFHKTTGVSLYQAKVGSRRKVGNWITVEVHRSCVSKTLLKQ